MPRTSPLAAVTLAAALLLPAGLLSACGSDEEPTAAGSPSPAAVDDGAGDPSTDAAEEPSEPVDTGSGEVADICTLVTAEEIGDVVGGTVTSEEVPGGGCSFSQDDPRAPSVSLSTTPYDEGNGGLEGAKAGVGGVIDGTVPDLDVGDGAFLVVGPALGGDNEQGGGAVHLGASLVQVTLTQGNGLSTEVVTGLVTDVLTLVASKG
ncbi:hypothetical protein BH11ACT8_BH11ACT8_08470 [soil metagenome]